MVNRKDRLEQLANISLFRSCSQRELAKVARAVDEVTVESGRVLVEQGAAGHECYVIVHGKASVSRDGKVIATLGAGDTVGELAMLDGGQRSASVTAATELELLVLGQREFAALLTEVPTLSHKILVSLARRVRELDERVYG
ncbi:MAG: cyclic nucleotide-binding domain-containing protein [Actinomycetes bacterium]